MTQGLFEAVDRYIDGLFVQEDEVLAAVVRTAEEAGMPPIHVSPAQGKFLYLLAKLSGARRVLEIGTLAGYSTIWLARALPDGGRVISLELDPKHAAVARENIARARLSCKVDILEGPALESMEQLPHEGAPFDLIFIDADKPGYPGYLDAIMPLTREGTLILADNVIRGGEVLHADTADEMATGARIFNEMFARHPRIEAIVLQQVGAKGHDGLALGVVKGVDFNI